MKKYLRYIKMAETAIDNLIANIPEHESTGGSEAKKQKLLECVLTGNSKSYLGKVYTEEQINKLDGEQINKLFALYEAKLSGQMVKSLGRSIINMYSMEACAVLGISNGDALSNDLENDPFLNSALQRFTCDLYYRFGSFPAPVSAGLITSRHYVAQAHTKNNITDNKNGSVEDRNNSSNDERPKES